MGEHPTFAWETEARLLSRGTGITIGIMLKSEPSLMDIGSALLDVARAVDAPDRPSATAVVSDLERLAVLNYWTWVEPSDDLASDERLRSGVRMGRDFARSLLRTLRGPDVEVLRDIVKRQAPELAERF